MKKRIICVFIVVCMLVQLQFFGTVNGAETEVYAPYKSSESFLRALNIIDGELDDTATVTRGQAAAYIIRLLDEQNNLLSYRGVFADVDSSNKNALAIEKLADLGIVRGDGDLCYRPEQFLTYDEAIRIFVNVLGYGVLKDIDSTAYQFAKKEGLTNNVRAEYDFVNVSDFVIMMYNTLMANPFIQTSFGANGAYHISEQTVLHKVYGIMYADGIIVKNDLTYLWTAQKESDTSIELKLADNDRLVLECDKISEIRDDLGKSVKVFYKIDDDTNENIYIYHEVKTVNRILNIGMEQLELGKTDFSKKRVVYYEIGKNTETSLKLSSDFSLIYNNVTYKSHTINFNDIKDKVGNLELIDANGDNAYETIKIKVYESLVVGNKSTEYNFINDKYDISKSVDIDEKNYNKILIYDIEGKVITFDDILAGSIISVAKSDAYTDDNVLEIRMSSNIKNGKITKYTKTGFVPSLQIDYEYSYNLFDRAAKENYIQNKDIIAYLDVFGNIVYTKEDYARDMTYGIVTRIGISSGGLDRSIQLKLVTAAGDVIETKLDKNPIIDGESYKDKVNAAYTKLSSIKTEVSDVTVADGVFPIRYRTNEDGNIKIIDTVSLGNGDTNDALEFLGGGLYVVNSGNILGWSVPYSSDATVLTISAEDYKNLDNYEKSINISSDIASSVFEVAEEYNVLTYKSDKESEYADFIVRFAGTNTSYGTSLFVVDEVVEAYNEISDEVMYQLNGYLKGTYKEVFINNNIVEKDELKNLRRGDVIRYSEGTDNSIIKHEPILKQNSDGTVVSSVSGHNINPSSSSSVTILCGYVYSKKDSLIKTNQFGFGANIENFANNIKWSETTLRTINILNTVPIMVVDQSDERIFKGTADDILDYENFGNNCSLVLMRFRSNTLNEVIIFNK